MLCYVMLCYVILSCVKLWYVCMHVCMYVGVWVCMYVCMHACLYVKMIACLSSYYEYKSIQSTSVFLGDFPAKSVWQTKSSRTVHVLDR